MKFTTTLAVLALINNVSAVALRDDDDLFTDNADEQETLNSIAQAEKAHGTKFNGISKEDEKALTTQKTKMTFQNDMFVMNERRVFGAADKNLPKGALLMIDDTVYPEPRPIGEIMMQIGFGPAEYDTKVLAGAQLNDDDDTATTLESLKAAEAISGNKMTTPEVNQENFKATGTEVEDFLARSHKVSTKELEDALTDKIPVNNMAQKEAM
jgi:hypothetical protein